MVSSSRLTSSLPAARAVSWRRRVGAAAALLLALAAGTQVPRLLADDASRPSRSGPAEAAPAARTDPTARPSVVDLVPPSRLPALPPAAAADTEAGATAFVRFWFDTLNYSLAHADTDALAGVTGAGCQQCSGWLIAISRWDSERSALEGGLTSPVDLAIGPFTAGEPVQFAATFLTTPATVTAADGTASDYPGGLTRGGATVRWSNGRWQMTDVVVDVEQPTSRGEP